MEGEERESGMQNLEEISGGDSVVPRISLQRNDSVSSSLSCTSIPFSRRSFSYKKIPSEPLKLCVLKLDGSSFDIQVARTGKVADLKRAVEAAFNHLPKTGSGSISWKHVWGKFCLSSYEGEKLLNENDYIGYYGIEDGDQLYFIRHESINYIKRRSTKDRDSDSEKSMRSSDSSEDIQENDADSDCIPGEGNLNRHDDRKETLMNQYCDDANKEDNFVITRFQSRLACLLRRWFSYHRLTNDY